LQHRALLSEIVATRVASSDESGGEGTHHVRHGGGSRRYRSGGAPGAPGGPGGLFGHMVGGLFGHR